jgi:glucose/arabinose dehydrogenase
MQIKRMVGLGAAVLLVIACHGSNNSPMEAPPISQSFDLRLQQIFDSSNGLSDLTDLEAPPGDARMFIAERTGQILVVGSNGAILTTPFIDLSARVGTIQGEGGLLSFTFDPNFSSNRFVYVHWTDNSITPTGDIVVERYQVSGADPDVLQVPGVEIIRIPHPDATNHYGGRVMFGPDGMLYLSTGDGGGANNQFKHAQDAASHLGKILRIDVSKLDANISANKTPLYDIPVDNPVWPTVGPNENWAIGVRNPFRPAFDLPTSRLYVADVGQNQFEEVDVIDTTNPLTIAGRNYGWSIMEGTHCFSASPCDESGLTLPVYDYDHNSGECAVIGGFVYRGSAIPGLQGTYLFSDLCVGFLRGLTLDGSGKATVVQAPAADAGNRGGVQSFGRDGAGELYILTGDGGVLKIVAP